MKALTVQQPWAWAIIHGGKTIENRTQAWAYRGPLAIHAGARWSDRGSEDWEVRRAVASAELGWPASDGEIWAADVVDPSDDRFARAAILGVVDLVDAHPATGCCAPWGEGSYVEHGGTKRVDVVHLVLENPRPLNVPIPCTGRLGLWTPPSDEGLSDF